MIRTYIYSEKEMSISEVIIEYAKELKAIEEYSHANKVMEYYGIYHDAEFLKELKLIFDKIRYSEKEHPVLIDGRIKSLRSFETKINRLISKGMPLSWIRDIFAFRILIDEPNPTLACSLCYNAVNKTAEVLNEQGFYPCENIETKENKPFDPKSHPEIYVPKGTGLDKSLIPCVKDYILRPKKNGYQSLHYTCQDYRTGRCIEVQIRTSEMHERAEKGSADHANYKKQTYKADEWDIERIKVQGFKCLGNGKYEDNIGLIDPIIIL